MVSSKRILGLAAAVALTGVTSYANAALVLRYDSPAAVSTGGSVAALVGPNGTALGPVTNAADTSTPPPSRSNNYGLLGDAGGVKTLGWDTGAAFSSFTAADGTFTAFAILNPLDNGGDNMVFGTTGGSPLHLGLRNDTAHFGMWGNDSNGPGGSAAAPNTTSVFAWRFSPDTVNAGKFVQDIFKDGVNVSSSNNHPGFADAGSNLIIGSSMNGGNFNGGIDDIRMYNTVLTDTEIATITTAMTTADAVPEPGTIAGLIGGASFLMIRRRRES